MSKFQNERKLISVKRLVYKPNTLKEQFVFSVTCLECGKLNFLETLKQMGIPREEWPNIGEEDVIVGHLVSRHNYKEDDAENEVTEAFTKGLNVIEEVKEPFLDEEELV